MQTSEGDIERILYAPGIGYKTIRLKNGFAKLEKMTEADRRAAAQAGQIGQVDEQSTRASIAKWLREKSDTRTVDDFIDDYIRNGHDLEKTKAQRRPT